MNHRNPYRGANDEVRPLESVVVFVDVLGFIDAMKNAYRSGEPINLLNNLREAVDSSYFSLQDKVEYPASVIEKHFRLWEFKAFTDNIVIGFPIKLDSEVEMATIFERLAVFQLSMIKYGFFIRGAIAVGEHYMDSDIVFGNALIEAYEAERNLALEPRIVLSRSAVKYFNRHLSYYTKVEDSWHYEVVLQDADNQLFINYLDIARPRDESENNTFFATLLEHRDMVLSRIKEFSTDLKIRSKYAWIANYHNYFCDQYSVDTSYKIDPQLLQLMPRRIESYR